MELTNPLFRSHSRSSVREADSGTVRIHGTPHGQATSQATAPLTEIVVEPATSPLTAMAPQSAPTPPATRSQVAWTATQKLAGQTVSTFAGKVASIPVAAAFTAMPASVAVPLGAILVVGLGGAASWHAAKQVEMGTGGGKMLRVLLTTGPVCVWLTSAFLKSTPEGRAATLGAQIASIAASATRDLLNAIGRNTLGDLKATDSRSGDVLSLPDLARDRRRNLLMAGMPLAFNAGIASAGNFGLPSALGHAIGDETLGQSLSDSLVRGAYTVPLESGRAVSGTHRYVEGKGRSAVPENLQDLQAIRGTLDHAGRHTGMRIMAKAFSTDLPDALAQALPEGSGARTAVGAVKSVLQAVGELRGQGVMRYEAAVEEADQSRRAQQRPVPGDGKESQTGVELEVLVDPKESPQQQQQRQRQAESIATGLAVAESREDSKGRSVSSLPVPQAQPHGDTEPSVMMEEPGELPPTPAGASDSDEESSRNRRQPSLSDLRSTLGPPTNQEP